MKKVKQILGNLSVSVISTLIFLLLIEFVFRIFLPQDLSGTWRAFSEKGYMLNKASWTARHEFKERVVHYHFNDLHLRADAIEHDQYKVLTLGDSFTFGWLLERDKTYVGLLQRYADKSLGADKVQFLNGAAGGWGLADMVDYVKEFGDRIQPNMLLVYFNTDDIGRSLDRFKFYNPKTGGLNKLKDLFKNSRTYQWFLEHSHLMQWGRKQLINLSLKQTEKPETIPGEVSETTSEEVLIPETALDTTQIHEGVQLAQDLFLQLHSWCQERNIPLLVYTTGWHLGYHEQVNLDDPEHAFLMTAKPFFEQHQIPFQDFTPKVVGDMGDNVAAHIIKGDHHPNEKGTRLIAKYSWIGLYPFLKKEN